MCVCVCVCKQVVLVWLLANSQSYQLEMLPSCTSRIYRLQDVGLGPRYGLVGTGLGSPAFYYQCLSCGWDCRSWHDATCVGTGVPDDPQRPIRIRGKHSFATAWRRRHSRHQCLHSAGSPWQPLWPTCSLRPIRASQQGPKVSTLGRASPSTYQARGKEQTR